jgi:hypothetical protein
LHVVDLSLTFFTTDFSSAFALICSFSGLTALGVCFLECIGEFDVVGVIGIRSSSVFEGRTVEKAEEGAGLEFFEFRI